MRYYYFIIMFTYQFTFHTYCSTCIGCGLNAGFIVEESSPATPVAQIDRGPDFVRLCTQATYFFSPPTSIVHQGEYNKCTVFFSSFVQSLPGR